MKKLTGIKAFEARWQSLRGTHTPSVKENRLLMQSMGRLVDNYASRNELIEELPDRLKGTFDTLVDAYLEGCWIEGEMPGTGGRRLTSHSATSPTISPAMLAAQQLRKQKHAEPTEASEAATYIVRDRRRCAIM